MECFFGYEAQEIYVCEFCGRIQRSKGWPPWSVHAPCKSKAVRKLAGSELATLFRLLGIAGKTECGCSALAAKMNGRGPQWCREHREEIIAKLKENYDLYGLTDKLTAAAKSLTTGLIFHINPFKPLESLLDLAIERSEKSP
jgi:hypothetical protein